MIGCAALGLVALVSVCCYCHKKSKTSKDQLDHSDKKLSKEVVPDLVVEREVDNTQIVNQSLPDLEIRNDMSRTSNGKHYLAYIANTFVIRRKSLSCHSRFKLS